MKCKNCNKKINYLNKVVLRNITVCDYCIPLIQWLETHGGRTKKDLKRDDKGLFVWEHNKINKIRLPKRYEKWPGMKKVK